MAIETEMAQTQALERAVKVLLENLPSKQVVVLEVKLTEEKEKFSL